MNEPFLHFAVNRTVSGEQKKYRESIRGKLKSKSFKYKERLSSVPRFDRILTNGVKKNKKKIEIESEELSMIKKSMVDIFLD